MYQILFRIPFLDLPIYGYGLMLAVGFIAAIYLARYLARRVGLDPDVFVNAGMIAMVTGVLGARLSHVIENWSVFTDHRNAWTTNLWNMVNIRGGGLTYYGGFLLATPSILLYLRHKRVPLRPAIDVFAPCVMVGLGFGRIGCLLNGCCYGAVCNANTPFTITFPYWSIPYQEQFDRGQINRDAVPQDLLDDRGRPADPHELLYAVSTPDPTDPTATVAPPAKVQSLRQLIASQRSLSVYPTQIYSTITAWLIALLCLAYLAWPHVPGRVFAMMLMVEGPSRFILELLRVEPPVWRRMSLSMILGIGILIAGVALWIGLGIVDRRSDSIPKSTRRTLATAHV
jgi:phosphatidylglycerol---prolipoprotein diacylglyceryl transferase